MNSKAFVENDEVTFEIKLSNKELIRLYDALDLRAAALGRTKLPQEVIIFFSQITAD